MVTLPFPEPGRLVEAAYRALDKAENGTPEQRRAHQLLGPLERPWDPPTCSPALRAQVWTWLDAVAAWVNHEYTWGVDRLIPPCWPAHPHIAHELAVLADLRRTAGRDTTTATLEYWHRDALPLFLERMHQRLTGSCVTGHQEWAAAARYRAFTNETAARERAAWFAHDLETVRPRATTAPAFEDFEDPDEDVMAGGGGIAGRRLWVVDPDTGEVIDPDAANGGR